MWGAVLGRPQRPPTSSCPRRDASGSHGASRGDFHPLRGTLPSGDLALARLPAMASDRCFFGLSQSVVRGSGEGCRNSSLRQFRNDGSHAARKQRASLAHGFDHIERRAEPRF